jgi:(S)-ureidoglycine aminohydrolase
MRQMKQLLTAITMLLSFTSMSQTQPLDSKVYTYASAATKGKTAPVKTVFSGSGAILATHQLEANLVNIGAAVSFKAGAKMERFIIIQQGMLRVNFKGVTKNLERGSVLFLMPNEEAFLENSSGAPAIFYLMQYQPKAAPVADSVKRTETGFMLDWKDIKFKAHDKGGVRQYFDIQTPMLHRFDIHVTQLNPGLKSHDPHTHKNEEIILMLDGNGVMQIGESQQACGPNDAVFLNSMVLHNITNTGTVPALYFAIQWN